MIQAKSFGGELILIPGAYARAKYPTSPGALRAPSAVVAVVGESNGGITYNATGLKDSERVNVFTQTSDAANVLNGGNGYYACEFYLTPTSDENLSKPNQVLFFRANTAVRATGSILHTATPIVDLTSNRYGVDGNYVTRKIQNGTTIGKRVTINFKGATIADKDDIGYQCLEIQYTGAGSAATMTISATTLTTTCTGASGDNLSIDLTQIKTVGDLVSLIAQNSAYTCLLKGRSDFNSALMDVVTAVDIKTAAYDANAITQAVIDFLNNATNGEITAALHSGSTLQSLDNDSGFVALTGGTQTAASNSDWAAVFTLLEKFFVNHIIVASSNPVIHGYAKDHCIKMSTVASGKVRTWSGGAALGATLSARLDAMRQLNVYRGEYACTPFKRRDVFNGGAVTEFAPFLGAALVQGIKYPNDVTISATFQEVDVLDVTEEYDKASEEALLLAGGTYFKRDGAVFTVGHNLTTYQGQGSLILNLPSMIRTTDQVVLNSIIQIKDRLKSLRRAPTDLQINEMENFILVSMLPGFVESGWLTKDPNNGAKAFSDVRFTINGDSFTFRCRALVPAPLHYGFSEYDFVVPGTISG